MDERVGDAVGLKLGDEVGSKSEGFSLGIEVFDVFGIPLFVGDALVISSTGEICGYGAGEGIGDKTGGGDRLGALTIDGTVDGMIVLSSPSQIITKLSFGVLECFGPFVIFIVCSLSLKLFSFLELFGFFTFLYEMIPPPFTTLTVLGFFV
jgi:hypothetical protein